MLCAFPGIATNSADPACEPHLNQKGKNAPRGSSKPSSVSGNLKMSPVLLFLTSDEALFITGPAIVVDQRDRAAREQQAVINDLHERYRALTALEREVMTLVVSGMLNKHIAAKIGASEATVKIHRGHVMEKMQAGSLIELVRMADKLKLSPTK